MTNRFLLEASLSNKGRYNEYFNQFTVLFLLIARCCSENRREREKVVRGNKITHLYISNCAVSEKKSINSRVI